MDIQLVNEPFPEVVFRQSHARSDGVHLSQIIRDLEETLYPNKYAGTTHWNLNIAAQVGVMWELVLERAYRDLFAVDVGELICDGVFGTPDGVGFDDDGPYVEEYKATYKGSDKSPVDVFHYRMQGLGYCKMLGVDRVMYRIIHLMGDWKGSGPQYRVWMIHWDQQEIDETWQSLLNHAKYKGWL